MSVNKLVVGCNYHTTWQRNKKMRFVLVKLLGNKAKLATRNTKKVFWTDTSSLIFINSEHNINKIEKINNDREYQKSLIPKFAR